MAPTSSCPSQFYTGLVVDLYDALASHPANADDYVSFLEGSGAPVLELGCGSGNPLLELSRRGYDIDGIDASGDMLALLRARADALGLSVRVYEQEMQAMSLPRRYRTIFLAGWTFTLLTSDDDARETIARMHQHLLPGGSVLIPLSVPDASKVAQSVGDVRETQLTDGTRLRFEILAAELDMQRRRAAVQTRYERIHPHGLSDVLERELHGSWWPREMFHDMLSAAGFTDIRATRPRGGDLGPGDAAFTFRARRTADA